MRKIAFILLIITGVSLFLCSPENPSIGSVPPEPSFTYSLLDANHIIFSVTSAEGFMINWDFDNGDTSQRATDTIFYPFADTYTVTLTVTNKGGASSTSQEVVINSFDSSVSHDNYWNLLTGGPDSMSGKTWVWDNDSTAFMYGLAQHPASDYNDPWIIKGRVLGAHLPDGVLNDDYVFKLAHFSYINDCKGNFLFDWAWANTILGANQPKDDDSVFDYSPPDECTWQIALQPGQDSTLLLTLPNSNSYLGICNGEGFSTYQVDRTKLTRDTLYVRFEIPDPDDVQGTSGPSRRYWYYLRLLAKK